MQRFPWIELKRAIMMYGRPACALHDIALDHGSRYSQAKLAAQPFADMTITRAAICRTTARSLARHNEECLAELKVCIDGHINRSANQLLICGSISQWIEQHINQSDLFVGRISAKLHLQPLTVTESAQFWAERDVTQTGFADSSSFSHASKSELGVTPSSLR